MSSTDAPVPTLHAPERAVGAPSLPPLSWPPPGTEPCHGRLWRIIGTIGAGGVFLVAPLLWSLAVPQPFWSLGPFEGNWEVVLGLTMIGLALLLFGFASLIQLLRQAARAADLGYGATTLCEVAADSRRDTGFLIQGRRHFERFDAPTRAGLVRARLRSAFLALAAALWLPGGFALGVLLAARGLLGATGIWVVTVAPTATLLALAAVLGVGQATRVALARRDWLTEAGDEHLLGEARGWQARLGAAADQVALGAGALAQGRRLRRAALAAAALFLVVLVPTGTIALTGTLGPVLASTAVPTFLSVQEMAGAAEVLRAQRLAPDPAVTPLSAGESLQNLVFVGPSQRPEEGERAPRERYDQPWFIDEGFPDPFSESAARDLMARDFARFTPAERAAILQASAHPAHVELAHLARAQVADIVTGRWTLPFGTGESLSDLPWPRFTAVRAAGLAHVARAAHQIAEGRPDEAEQTVRELISAGFVLVDQGPTLIDNLLGVTLVNMGGDALEELYRKTGRGVDADRLGATRQSAALASTVARAGSVEHDIHTLVRGIPDLVEREDALRGMRWEYLATFNMLAPCINLQKMVFGPDQTYAGWMERAERALVRVPGEAALFELARSGATGAQEDRPSGLLPRLLNVTLGAGTQPGSCARLVSALSADG